jgi:hypothetical protein
MSSIKSFVMGGMLGAFAAISGAAIASAETIPPAPVLLTAPAEAFPVKSDATPDLSKKDFATDAITVAQVDPAADRFAAQGPRNEIAPPHPATRSSFEKATPKTAVHAKKRTENVAYLEHNMEPPSRPHGPVMMLGVGY